MTEKHPQRKLGIILGLVALISLLISIWRLQPEGADSSGLLGVTVSLFALMCVLLSVWFPKLVALLVAGWIVPVALAFAVGFGFIFLGGLIYPNFAWLDEAINGDNTALSMAIVLPWIGAGITLGIFTWVKFGNWIINWLGRFDDK